MQHIDNDRFSRLLAMSSYPAESVMNARVVVGGVGALGNELVKNLCLLGFRHIHLIDKDSIERSNLTRSVLFSERDVGKSKVQVAAESARRIYNDVRVSGHFGDVADVGFGVYRRADLIFSDFDGFYPRIFINEAALKVKKPWIDAALGINPQRGSVMLYNASNNESACFVCRIGVETAVRELLDSEGLIGCQNLDSKRIEAGFVPTSPTTSAAIAAIQTQAGLDLLRLGVSDENPWTKTGLSLDLGSLLSTRLKLKKVNGCPGHHPGKSIAAGSFFMAEHWKSKQTTVAEAFTDVRRFMEIGDDVELYLQYHTLFKGIEHCLDCGAEVSVFSPVYVTESRKKRGDPILCSHCGSSNLESDNELGEFSAVEEKEFPGSEQMTLADAGFRKLDIAKFFYETEDSEVICHVEIAGDAEEVFSPLSKDRDL